MPSCKSRGTLTGGTAESYWAALTLGYGIVTVIKGTKEITPQKPTVDATEPFLRYVRIGHAPSGVPVISDGELDGQTLYDRFAFEPGSGLDGTLHAGQAIGASTWRYRSHSTPLVFQADTTSYVWLTATGRPLVTASSETLEKAALLLWEVTTDSAAVTNVRDQPDLHDELARARPRRRAARQPGARSTA